MIDLRKIEQLVDGIARALPAGGEEIRAEVRDNVRLVLEASFSRMNLVTREEFDAQAALLARTREKLDALERVVAALEREADAR